MTDLWLVIFFGCIDICLLSSQGQADLLKHARAEVMENLNQIHYAALACNLVKGVPGPSSESKSCRSLEAIPEKAVREEDITDEEN